MFGFKKEESEFYDLFVESAEFFYNGALIMDEVMMDYSKADDQVQAIQSLEHEADAVNDKIVDKLNQSFITPIDREDIYALANGLDDGVDDIQGTLQRMVMYRVTNIPPGAKKLTKILIEATRELIRAFTLLKDIKKNQVEILEITHKIGALESESDLVYRHEVAFLFQKEEDPKEIIKWKDLLEHLEDTLDYCENLAKMIRGVVMKYA